MRNQITTFSRMSSRLTGRILSGPTALVGRGGIPALRKEVPYASPMTPRTFGRAPRIRATFSATILNHGLERTSPYLAASPSQIQTWLSRTTNTAGTDLSLTSTPSVAGSAGQSEIVSARTAGAGIPRRIFEIKKNHQPKVLLE